MFWFYRIPKLQEIPISSVGGGGNGYFPKLHINLPVEIATSVSVETLHKYLHIYTGLDITLGFIFCRVLSLFSFWLINYCLYLIKIMSVVLDRQRTMLKD